MNAAASAQRSTLWIVLALNLALAAGLAGAGVSADSSALAANALDNASDAVVYGISLFAIGRAPIWKQRAAHWAAALLLIFGLGVAADALRRFFTGSEPIGATMMAMAAIAAVVNLACLFLLRRLKSDDVNMEAAETFSFNDFASNGSVLIAGALVMWFNQSWPDLLVGVGVALIAIKGSADIWRSAQRDQVGEKTKQ